ncbi:MAG TPA: hypothetical protein VEF53_21710 [Patescibacteria group bacterium]|nr:hypothetical protein [Patescibacteria group bacterium]
MEAGEFKIILLSEDTTAGSTEEYKKVCRYLLQRYCEGCEGYESFGLFASINRGTGREGLFDASTED